MSSDPNSSSYFFLASRTFCFRSFDLDGSSTTPSFLIFSGKFESLLDEEVVVGETVVVDGHEAIQFKG